MLLRLRVANHKSIRNEVELSFTLGGFNGSSPPSGDWKSVTNRVTAIYGANGSGKSTVLDVLDFIRGAVQFSATKWADNETFPHYPFLLDEESQARPSLYEIDFVDAGVRYTYGFESNAKGVVSEWLNSYPSGRRRMLFDRSGEDIRVGRSLGGETSMFSRMTGPTHLYLSVGALAKHKLLAQLRHAFLAHILYARYDPNDQKSRVNWAKGQLLKNDALYKSVQRIVGFADLGVSKLEVEDLRLSDPEELEIRVRLRKKLEERGIEVSESQIDKALAESRMNLSLTHASADLPDGGKALPFESESSGTIAWLSLIVPVLHAIQGGLVFLIDELDASLHPRLSATIVELFNDPEVNKSGAQLIFTSHDTALLGNNLNSPLSKDQVWFTEKDASGATAVYALDEFTVRATDNVEKRYLEGRYGALPLIDAEGLRRVLTEAR